MGCGASVHHLTGKRIELKHREITDVDVERIASTLTSAKRQTEHLELKDVGLLQEQAEVLLDALKSNNTVTYFGICYDMINYGELLADVLRKNETLQTISFLCNRQTVEDACRLLNGLEENRSVKVLRFADPEWEDNSEPLLFAKTVAQMLRTNTTLQGLDLTGCNFSGTGMFTIIQALENNQSLLRLNVEQHAIPSDMWSKSVPQHVLVSGLTAQVTTLLRRNDTITIICYCNPFYAKGRAFDTIQLMLLANLYKKAYLKAYIERVDDDIFSRGAEAVLAEAERMFQGKEEGAPIPCWHHSSSSTSTSSSSTAFLETQSLISLPSWTSSSSDISVPKSAATTHRRHIDDMTLSNALTARPQMLLSEVEL